MPFPDPASQRGVLVLHRPGHRRRCRPGRHAPTLIIGTHPTTQRLPIDPEIVSDLRDRHPRPRPEQRDRTGLELREIVLHHHLSGTPDLPRPSRSKAQVSRTRGQLPAAFWNSSTPSLPTVDAPTRTPHGSTATRIASTNSRRITAVAGRFDHHRGRVRQRSSSGRLATKSYTGSRAARLAPGRAQPLKAYGPAHAHRDRAPIEPDHRRHGPLTGHAHLLSTGRRRRTQPAWPCATPGLSPARATRRCPPHGDDSRPANP